LSFEIYIKAVKKISIAERRSIRVKDLAEVVCTDPKKEQSAIDDVKNIQVYEIKENKKANYLITITDIIARISQKYPKIVINNVGEAETVLDYKPTKSKDNPYWKWAKVGFIVLVIFAGSSTAIMTYHTDVQLVRVFENLHKIFFGTEQPSPWVIDIPYSIGLAVGIIAFFNHFFGKKVTDDPTPIEVEMTIYESDVTQTMGDILNTDRIRKNDE
jgi:stage V sporulation protein AA